jgi:hypothetical protein
MPKLKIRNFNDVNFKVFSSGRDGKSRFNIIPLTINENYFGKLILKDRELYLIKINEQKAILNEDKLVLDEISSMYLYKDYVIISINKDSVIYRDIYDCASGIVVSKIQDKIVKDNLFIRKIGNNSLTVLKDSIVKIESERKLFPIKYRPKPLKDEPNTLIGS